MLLDILKASFFFRVTEASLWMLRFREKQMSIILKRKVYTVIKSHLSSYYLLLESKDA